MSLKRVLLVPDYFQYDKEKVPEWVDLRGVEKPLQDPRMEMADQVILDESTDSTALLPYVWAEVEDKENPKGGRATLRIPAGQLNELLAFISTNWQELLERRVMRLMGFVPSK